MSEVRQAAIGKWHGILARLGVDEKFLTRRNGPCPMCEGKDRWRWTDHESRGMWICTHCGPGDGFDLLMKLHGWEFSQAATEVEAVLGVVPTDSRSKSDPAKRIHRIKVGAVKSHPTVSNYLRSRGLETPPGLRAHPELAYYHDGHKAGTYPAMVGAVQAPDGKLVSLHLTYLNEGRKAPVESPRKMLPPDGTLRGAAIRLYPRADHMGVAEGIETAIAAKALSGLPTWAVINTTLMEQWEAPEGVERVTVFADRDRNYAGEKAAYALAFRLVNAGLEVVVQVPPELGDWNDVLLAQRKSA